MSDIFLSYAREDRDKAELLARAFEQQEWAVWWDKVIPPGKKYAEVIGEELASAKAVIVLWSRASVASDWVKDEAQEGANRGILVPVLVDKVNPPYGFRQVQTADLSDWDGSSSHAEVQSLVRGIGGLINKPVSNSALSSNRTDSGKRGLLLYLLAGGVLALLLGYAAYRLLSDRGIDPNQNQIAVGNRGGNNQNQPGGSSPPCDIESRHRAADLTGKGLMMIDPGGNQAAAVLQFTEAISECNDYTDAYFWRAQSFVALQQNKKAIADFNKVVEITNDADTLQKAQKFIADIEGPNPTPTSMAANTNTTNSSGSNANATNTGASNANQGTTHPEIVSAQVNEMFASDRSTRIAATTRLIIGKKQDAATVQMSVKSALAHPDNKSGIINTLVYLENVDPAILKQNRGEIEKLLAVAKDNGAQTADHIRKVQTVLNN
jgi:tetratricopeptide (TPR) repeat protein